MLNWKRAIAVGFVSWLIPFVIAFPLFRIKASNASLYSTILTLIGLASVAWLLRFYFSDRKIAILEAIAIGVLWTAMNLVLDAPFFFGPLHMTVLRHFSEIG